METPKVNHLQKGNLKGRTGLVAFPVRPTKGKIERRVGV